MTNKPDEYRCAILADGVYVGNVYLTGITKDKADYHIFIGERNYWGKGVAREASKQILEHALSVLRLKRVELRVRKENCRAVSLYTSLGFKIINDDDTWFKMAKENCL